MDYVARQYVAVVLHTLPCFPGRGCRPQFFRGIPIVNGLMYLTANPFTRPAHLPGPARLSDNPLLHTRTPVAWLLTALIFYLGGKHPMDHARIVPELVTPIMYGVMCALASCDPIRYQHRDTVDILPQVEHCSSRHQTIWLGVLLAYKALLLLFGAFLAWETLTVRVAALNDSRLIGMSIYNVLILTVIGVPGSMVMGVSQDAALAFEALLIILCTTVTLGLVFVPKVKHPTSEGNIPPKQTGKRKNPHLQSDANFSCTCVVLTRII